jgi:triosephosphate isomerase (TIM)
MRALFIAGNWKMNPPTLAEAEALAGGVKAGLGQEAAVRVAVCPPAVFLQRVDAVLANSPVGLGAQNMHWDWQTKGNPFTGELSGPMLVDAGCTHVILGHSERRHPDKNHVGVIEVDHIVNQKVHAALRAGLIPIVCVGETREERESGRTEGVVGGQLLGSLAGVTAEQMAGVVLAYEPVWAINTGLTATPDQAQEVHAYIRHLLADRFGAATAGRVVVQYGGSVKPENAAGLLACPDIDGALVGGASLQAADFLAIVAAARQVTAAGKP